MSVSRRTVLITAAAAAAVAAPAMSIPAARAAAPRLGKQVPGFFRFNSLLEEPR